MGARLTNCSPRRPDCYTCATHVEALPERPHRGVFVTESWGSTSDMCRFLAYSGEPVFLSDLVCAPTHSLVHQSLHADEGKTETNGDGFGIGWYGERSEPGRVPRHIARMVGREFGQPVRAGAGQDILRACPCLDGHRHRPGELPSLRPRPAPVHAQRPDRRLPPDQAASGGPDPGRVLRRAPGQHRFRGDLSAGPGERTCAGSGRRDGADARHRART